MKSSVRVHPCFRGHTVSVISPSHISNFPSLTPGGQLLLHTQPQLFLRPPSNTVISRQSLAFYEASLARERWCRAIRWGSPHFPRGAPGRLKFPNTTLRIYIWVALGSALHGFQFVWLNRRHDRIREGSKFKECLTSEAVQATVSWTKAHGATSGFWFSMLFPSVYLSTVWLSLSHCLTMEQRGLLSKDSFGKQRPCDLPTDEGWGWGGESEGGAACPSVKQKSLLNGEDYSVISSACVVLPLQVSRVTLSVPSQSPRHSWTMWSTAEVYWQKENHHKVRRKEQGAPPTTRCPYARCTAVRKHMRLSVHILRTPGPGVRYTARKGRPACGVNNALISTAGEPSG